MSENVEDGRTIRPFAQFLHEYREGALSGELGEALNQLTQAVVETDKVGKLTVTLTVRPAARRADMVIVSDEIKLAAPQADREQALFFVDANANLTRRNPNQPELPLVRQVDDGDSRGA